MSYLYNSAYLDEINPANSNNYPLIEQIDYLYDPLVDIKKNHVNNKKTLVVLDIDKTIFRETTADDGEIMFKDVPEYTYKMRIEQNSIELINSLTKSADVICLTIRHFKYYVNLQQYGIYLCNKYNKIELTNLQQQQMLDNGYIYHDNVIYTSGTEKGTALLMFYNFSATKYDKVFFIDDQHKYCEQINTKLTDNNIDVTTYQIEPKIKVIDNDQVEKNNFIEEIVNKQQPYFHTKCEILVNQPIDDLVGLDIAF